MQADVRQTDCEAELIGWLHEAADAEAAGGPEPGGVHALQLRAAGRRGAAARTADRGAHLQPRGPRGVPAHVGHRRGGDRDDRRLRYRIRTCSPCDALRWPWDAGGHARHSRDRRDRIRVRIARRTCEALLVTNLPDVRYLCGFSGSNGALLVTGRRPRARHRRPVRRTGWPRSRPDVELVRHPAPGPRPAGHDLRAARIGHGSASTRRCPWRPGGGGRRSVPEVDVSNHGGRHLGPAPGEGRRANCDLATGVCHQHPGTGGADRRDPRWA